MVHVQMLRKAYEENSIYCPRWVLPEMRMKKLKKLKFNNSPFSYNPLDDLPDKNIRMDLSRIRVPELRMLLFSTSENVNRLMVAKRRLQKEIKKRS